MSGNQLPPDPDSVEKWKQLPQNPPSKQALPPATGGMRWARWFLALLLAALIIAIILQSRVH
jgi:hypothetical protein